MKQMSFEKIRSASAKLTNNLKKYITVEHCVIRFIMAWCFVSVLQTIYIKINYNETIDKLDFTGKINLTAHVGMILLAMLIVFIVFSCINRKIVEKISLLVITMVYALICVTQYSDTFFSLGIAGLMTFSIVYCFKDIDSKNIKISLRVYRVILSLCFVMFVGFVGGSFALRYLTYSSPNFDLGLFTQMFHYMKKNLSMYTTSERDKLLSHFCVHISPAFYILLPVYMIIPSAATLQFMQSVVVALGIIPLSKICNNHNMSRFETLLICIGYLAYPVISGGGFYDIHENIFLPVFLLFLLYYFEKDSWVGIIVSTVLVFSVKEDASVYVAVIALFMMLERRQYKKGTVVAALSIVYFVFTTVLLSKIGEGVMSYRFNNMIYGQSGSMIGIIRTVLTNPSYILTQMMQAEKMEYIIQTLAPLCFIPLLSKKWYRFILFIPYVMFTLMSDYAYFHSIYFQYVFGSGTLLIYLTVLNLSELQTKIRSVMIPMTAIFSMIFFMSLIWNRAIVYYDNYRDDYNRTICDVLDEAVESIPKDATVTATTFLCPALADRDILYELYYTDENTEYTILDLRTATTEYSVDTYLNNQSYETVYYKPFIVAVFRNKNY